MLLNKHLNCRTHMLLLEAISNLNRCEAQACLSPLHTAASSPAQCLLRRELVTNLPLYHHHPKLRTCRIGTIFQTISERPQLPVVVHQALSLHRSPNLLLLSNQQAHHKVLYRHHLWPLHMALRREQRLRFHLHPKQVPLRGLCLPRLLARLSHIHLLFGLHRLPQMLMPHRPNNQSHHQESGSI